MTHDSEKSHSAIVAAKPTNNAPASKADAAEPVEPRAETERKAREQSTLRTQGRARVSQALEGLRKAARQKKKEKFTALFHHISIDLLRESFFALKRDAAPGVDGQMWVGYAKDLEPRLRAWPLSAIPAYIPGSPATWRMTDMKKSRFTKEQIIGIIKQAKVGMPN